MESKPERRLAFFAVIALLFAGGGYLAYRALSPAKRGPVVIAVLGTGFNARKAADVAPRLLTNEKEIPDNQIDDDGNGYPDDWISWNFADGNNDLSDKIGSGTNSVRLAAQGCPECRLLPIKVESIGAGDAMAQLGEAIVYAVDRGASVISVPYALPRTSQELKDALAKARRHGVIVIAAAAIGTPEPFKPRVLGEVFPQAYPEIIVVGATEVENVRDPAMNYGDLLDFSIVQPREAKPPKYPKRSFYFGSSYAAAEAAGYAAQLLTAHPAYDLRTVRQLLREASEPPAVLDPRRVGYGYLIPEALTRLKPAALSYRLYHGSNSTIGIDFNGRDDIGAIGGIWVCKSGGKRDSRGVLVLQNNLIEKGRARLLMGAPPEAGCAVKARVSFRGNNDVRDLEIAI